MTTDQKINTILTYLLESDPEEQQKLRNKLWVCKDRKTKEEPLSLSKLESITHELLTDIGVPAALQGYRYLVIAIMHTAEHPDACDNMYYGIYTQVAMMEDTLASRVERSIRAAVSSAFEHGNTAFLQHNFRSQINPKTGSIPSGHFIARCAILVRQRLNNYLPL